ncbi:DUF3987 domain-containing protein [Ornithobacterium rhinotracheale]|uniref:DUF3987 domain-containing protein n=1 Tax=Ornithobacterium rhinotracheale TaxID=28251 RepID=A0A3R5XTY6_ORNRH|nr:DUF3987 domain-containing protein [Ornithobacterium rhinotracheale]MRJ11321.1 DUF3987 domain-containing protein [Ornithobacterium rhinotracheale]QAR30425.1 DUF3987 domain-containing protein [Ornithobacterium rhinotracheale]
MDSLTLKNKILTGLELDFSRFTINNLFPIDVFPVSLQTIIKEVDKNLSFLPDYFGTALLYSTSVALGSKIKLKIKESWYTSSSIYLVIVGRTGDAKSHAISLALKPIDQINTDNFKIYKSELKEYKKNISEEKVKKPTFKQLIINDATSEALVKVMYETDRGIGLYYDEIRGFINSFGMYKAGNNDEEMILSLWAGKPITKNRVSEDTILITNTKLDIIGSIQPELIGKTFNGNKLNNGFIERFLFAIPFEYRSVKWNKRNIDLNLIQNYNEIIRSIYDFSENLQEPLIIEYSEEAFNYIVDWQNNLPSDFDFEYERGINIKLQEYTQRFSLLLQVLDDIVQNKRIEKVNLKSVQNAIKLFEYFRKNALKVREIMNQDYLDSLSTNQKTAYKALPQTFSTREAKQILQKLSIMKERNIYYFLKDKKLFKRLEHGKYEKIYSY